MVSQNAIGGQSDRRIRSVCHGLRDFEHVIRVNLDDAGKGQACAVVPRQCDGGVDAKRVAAVLRPLCIGARDLRWFDASSGGPAIKRVICVGAADRREHGYDFGVLVLCFAVVLERQIIDATAKERNRTAQAVGLDFDPRSVCKRAFARFCLLHGRGWSFGYDRWKAAGVCLRCQFSTGLRVQRCFGFGRRKQDEPNKDHQETECRCKNKVPVLIVHRDCHLICSISAWFNRVSGKRSRAFGRVGVFCYAWSLNFQYPRQFLWVG